MDLTSGRARIDLDGEIGQLRSPHGRRQEKQIENVTTKSPLATKSTLSPAAREFPRPSSSQLWEPRSVQSRLYKFQYPGEHDVELPASKSDTISEKMSQLNLENTKPSDSNSNPELDEIVLNYLDSLIDYLNQNPGEFDKVASKFLRIYEGLEDNSYILSVSMENIYRYSIENPNFKYIGAKLYNLLYRLNPYADSLFCTLLQYKLNDTIDEVKQLLKFASYSKVIEIILFLAELYMQVRQTECHVKLMAENIFFIMKKLIATSDINNIRCICNVLKLTGHELDLDCNKDIADIMRLLTLIYNDNPEKYPFIQHIIFLSKCDWGHVKNENLKSANEQSHNSQMEPTFYGPDGKVLSAEENAFLHTCVSSPNEEYFDEYGDVDSEMDEEAENDYIAFCKLGSSNKKS